MGAAPAGLDVQRVAWATWRDAWPAVWRQGQHVTLIGPTGCGKSTLAGELVNARGWVVALGTKPRDATLQRLIDRSRRAGAYRWRRVRSWPPPSAEWRRVMLWPEVADPRETRTVQRAIFDRALHDIYNAGSWCVWVDELRYLCDYCGMRDWFTLLYTQARALGISVLGAAQRPAWVPLEAYSQAGHLLVWRTGDERDLARIGSLNGLAGRAIAAVVNDLAEHEFAHINLHSGTVYVTRQQLGGG